MVLQSGKPFGVEPPDAPAHGLRTHTERLGNTGRRLTPAGTPDNARPLDPACRRRPRTGQALDRGRLIRSQVAQTNRRATHGKSPAKEKPSSYAVTCRMNH